MKSLLNEAPAVTVARQTAALAAEHGKTFAKKAMRSFGVSVNNVPHLILSNTVLCLLEQEIHPNRDIKQCI